MRGQLEQLKEKTELERLTMAKGFEEYKAAAKQERDLLADKLDEQMWNARGQFTAENTESK